ncbi:MAG: hypothetical protein CMJ76_11830 [Planctomycetaceae bacterium]|nr:hypothetical protein [Planctomycetaceae bacterium]|tara:strand:- start:59 stop:352 length:294 start_codon:yes stop_codon:yes gene_type:complete
MPSSAKVATFFSQTEALIAAEYLRGNGIVATVMGDDAGGAFSGLTLSKGFEIYVPQADEAIAIELLENPPADQGQTSNDETVDPDTSDNSEINQDEY